MCLCSLRRGDVVRGQGCVDGDGLYVVGGRDFVECSRAYVVRHKLSVLLRGSMFYSMNFKQTGMDTLMSFPVAVSKPVALSRLKMVILSES